jgi:mycothiol synthase
MSEPEAVSAALHALAARNRQGNAAIPEAAWRAAASGTAQGAVTLRVAAVLFPSDSFAPQVRQLAVLATDDATADDVAATARRAVADTVERPVVAWLPGSPAVAVAGLTAAGFVEHRRQHQMQVALPVPPPVWPDGVDVRRFRPGEDDDAWLAVNNRAFANHPDQGGWIRAALTRRMEEPWFDPAGFLLAWRDDALAGFCWTKVHDDGTGEIFVIGVDPDTQGIGLGRALVLGGLDHLARVRRCAVGLLYVAADNAGALALYDSLGFRISRTDVALVLAR